MRESARARDALAPPLLLCWGARPAQKGDPQPQQALLQQGGPRAACPARRPASQQLDARALQLKEEGKTREALFQDEMTQQMETLMELQSKLDDDMGDLKVTTDINFTMNTLAAAFEKGGD